MFCPRCGRQLSETANFCGGCGLSKVEIEKYTQSRAQTVAPQPVTPQPTVSEEPQTTVPFGTVVNEPEKTVADIVTDADFAPVSEPVAEPVTEKAAETPAETVTEPVAETVAEPVKPAEEPAYKAPEASYHYSYVNSTQNRTSYTAQPVTSQPAQPQTPAKNENLSTVDFIWMLLISSIPVIGFVYLFYLAIQDNNTNKRSYARATLIIAAFAVVISLVFAVGFLIAGL